MLIRDHRTHLVAPLAALLLVVPLAGCGEDQGPVDTGDAQQRTGEDTEADDGEVLRFEELAEDLDDLVGDEVSVTATVDEVVTPGVFAITGEDPESMVVVDVAPEEDVETDTEVVVTGTVQPGLDDLEVEDLLATQLDDELLNDWEGEPFLEADEVDTTPHE